MEINNLIANYLTGKASNDELESLNLWKEESKDNLKALEQMKANWSELDELKDYNDYNAEEAWDALDSKLDSTAPVAKTRRLSPWMGMAASLLLIAACFWYFSSDDQQQVQSFTTEDSVENVKTSDGSEVNLGEFSSLAVGENFDAQRNLDLKGKAFFDVAHDKEKPFRVQTKNGNITVLGTEFSVISTDKVFEVYVQSGSVAVDFNDKKIILTKGEACELYNGVLAKYDMNDRNYLSWNKKELIFQDASISEIKGALERHYGIEIHLDKKVLTNQCRINSVYSNESLDNVLSEMKKVFKLQYSSKDNIYKFSDIKC